MSLRIFLDTEFTNFIDTSLISLGMVTEGGEEFYAEVPYPETECSDFVRMAVIPWLGRDSNAVCLLDELRGRILTWLEVVRRVDEVMEICFTAQVDWDLFADALDYVVPEWCRRRMILADIDQRCLYEFYRERGLPEHHALYDAMASRHAFLREDR